MERARDLPAEHRPLPARLELGVRDRDRRQERPGVGVQGLVVERLPVGQLHDPAQVHHGHAVGDVPHDREVVGDEEIGQAELRLEVLQEVDDLGLDRDVERRDGLVADDQRGLHGEGARDAHALPLAARELVRVAVGVLRQEPDVPEQILHARRARVPVGHDPVHAERLGQDLADGHPGVERAVGVLEDHLDPAPEGPEGGLVERREVLAFEEDRPARRPLELQDAPPRRRLAAARLADEAEGLAAADREAHPVHRADHPGGAAEQAGAHVELLDELPDLEQRRVAHWSDLREAGVNRGWPAGGACGFIAPPRPRAAPPPSRRSRGRRPRPGRAAGPRPRSARRGTRSAARRRSPAAGG